MYLDLDFEVSQVELRIIDWILACRTGNFSQ